MAEQMIEVSHAGDVGAARRAARDMAIEIGFEAIVGEEVALAVTELATNLVKHAHGGTICLAPVMEDGRRGIEVVSQDHGPGFRDAENALRDGMSTAATLGYGLGAVNRLMDTLEIVSHAPEEGGTRIVSRRWLGRVPRKGISSPIDVGVATRPHPLEVTNGDSFVILQWDDRALVGVIDGLGHGPFARRAAETARQYIETHYEQPLDLIFTGVGRACLGTRGVVMALAKFSWSTAMPSDSMTISVASIGNVEMRTFGTAEPIPVMVRRGIVGLNAPLAVVTRSCWSQDSILVVHSDGLRTHWRADEFRELWASPASTIAQGLMKALHRDTDDATVLVAKQKARQGGGGAQE